MKVRKIKHKSPKNFGSHSFIMTEQHVASCGDTVLGRKYQVGSKVIHPADYKEGFTENRTRRELINDAERNHEL